MPTCPEQSMRLIGCYSVTAWILCLFFASSSHCSTAVRVGLHFQQSVRLASVGVGRFCSGTEFRVQLGGGGVSGSVVSGSRFCFSQIMWFCWLHWAITFEFVLGLFAAKCEVAGMRIRSSKSKAIVLSWKRVECPLQFRTSCCLKYRTLRYLSVCSQMKREWSRRLTDGYVTSLQTLSM